jgi:hypothetical protein
VWPSPRFTSIDLGYCRLDNLTGLMWPANGNLAAATMTWQAALNFVASTMNGAWQYCGYSDWRLPNSEELASLLNYGAADMSSWLASAGFNSIGDDYRSSSADSSGWAYSVDFPGHLVHLWPQTNADGHVLAVRGSSAVLPKTGIVTSYATGDDGYWRRGVDWPSPRFTPVDFGYCLVDHLTGLMWPADGNLAGGGLLWQEGLDFVTGTMNGTWAYCGFTDWRLPNVVELRSLMSLGQDPTSYLGNAGFKNIQDYYMTSTSTPSLVITVSRGGQSGEGLKSLTWDVFPVRSAVP